MRRDDAMTCERTHDDFISIAPHDRREWTARPKAGYGAAVVANLVADARPRENWVSGSMDSVGMWVGPVELRNPTFVWSGFR